MKIVKISSNFLEELLRKGNKLVLNDTDETTVEEGIGEFDKLVSFHYNYGLGIIELYFDNTKIEEEIIFKTVKRNE